jgi:hypothetical protein
MKSVPGRVNQRTLLVLCQPVFFRIMPMMKPVKIEHKMLNSRRFSLMIA